MNKKLIALAVAGASVAPAAMAQTANPVTLYGRVYVTFESVEAKGGATPVARRNRVTDQASLLGVRGTEDLGGGLKAFFQLETAFPPDQNANAGPGVTTVTNNGFANRNSAIGLQGGFGSILLGRWDTPMKVTQTAVDPCGDLTIGDITGAALDQGNFSRREQNSVQYWSPNLGRLRGSPAVHGERGQDRHLEPERARRLASTYSARQPLRRAARTRSTRTSATVAGSNASEDGMAIAASYHVRPGQDLGPVRRVQARRAAHRSRRVVHGRPRVDVRQARAARPSRVAARRERRRHEPECDMGSIGYRYDFTRRTFFIASYTKVENDSTA